MVYIPAVRQGRAAFRKGRINIARQRFSAFRFRHNFALKRFGFAHNPRQKHHFFNRAIEALLAIVAKPTEVLC